jgi:hypothetical protein
MSTAMCRRSGWAEEIATLDQFTHGRFDFGVGAGVILGVEGDQARAIYQEALTAAAHRPDDAIGPGIADQRIGRSPGAFGR